MEKEAREVIDVEYVDIYTCPFCGGRVVLDPATRALVCSSCGVVLGYEHLPSYVQLSHSAPMYAHGRIEVKLDREVIERARELFGEALAREISRLRRDLREEVLRALEVVVHKRTYHVSWRALKKALEIARKHSIDADLSKVREERVRAEIRRLIEELKLDIDPEEVWKLALRNRNLWSGRKATTIAQVFVYLYAKRMGVKVTFQRKVVELAESLSRVVEW